MLRATSHFNFFVHAAPLIRSIALSNPLGSRYYVNSTYYLICVVYQGIFNYHISRFYFFLSIELRSVYAREQHPVVK